MEKYYTIQQVCNMLDINRTTFYRWKDQLNLPTKKIGGRVYIIPAELDRWIDETDKGRKNG